jgi:hypothetical protein
MDDHNPSGNGLPRQAPADISYGATRSGNDLLKIRQSNATGRVWEQIKQIGEKPVNAIPYRTNNNQASSLSCVAAPVRFRRAHLVTNGTYADPAHSFLSVLAAD